MESPQSTATTGSLNIQRCIENFSRDLAVRFDNDAAVPPSGVGVRRFTARHKATGQACFITLRHYQQALNASQLDLQRAILARVPHQDSVNLCGMLESRIEPEAHYVVSTQGGDISLHQILKQQRRLDVGPVCELLTQLGEALETVTHARWPRAMLDTHAIYLSASSTEAVRPVRIVVPPLPGPEIQPGTSYLPLKSSEYVLDLALLCCELLGMPARRQRFRPLPHLSAETNHLLRSIIEGGIASTFDTARQFAAAFIASGTTQAPGSTAIIGMTTVSGPSTMYPVPATTAPAPAQAPVPVTTTSGPSSTTDLQQATTAAVGGPVGDTQRKQPRLALPAMPSKPLCSHARLSSITSPHLPQLGLCLGDEIRIGRSASAHFVAQFFPRNPRNDNRTRLLSREHFVLRREGVNITIGDLPGANQSFIGGRPVEPGTALRRSSRLTLAGEYDMDLRRLDTWWADGEVWEDMTEKPPVPGTLSLAPTHGAPALEYRTMWIFTDAAFGINSSTGSINPQPLTIHATLGWFLCAHGGLWVLASEDDGSVALDGCALKGGKPVPLHHDSVLKIGLQEWRVQSLAAP